MNRAARSDEIEQSLEAQIEPWLEHMRWRADFEQWRYKRLWQENFQGEALADIQSYANGANAGSRVLDLGAGMGGFAVALALSQVEGLERAGGEVIALDYNFAYAEIARTRARRYALSLPALVAAGEALPFADQSFGLLTCWDVVEHVQDPRQLFSEIARVLKPDGRAFITIINRFALTDPHYHLRFVNWLPRALAEKYIAWRQRTKTSRLRDRQKLGEMNYFTFGQAKQLAARYGFTLLDLNAPRSRLNRLPRPVGATLYRLWRTFGMGTYRLVLVKERDPRPSLPCMGRREREGVKVALFNVTTTTQMGGVESFVWEIAARLPAHKVQVDILGGAGAITRELPASVRVKTFSYLSRQLLARIPLLNRSAGAIKLVERFSFGLMCLPTLVRERYDIIHIQKPYDLPLALLAKMLSGSKLLFGCHGTDYFWGDKFFARMVDGAVSCSRFNASQIWGHYQLAPVVVFNGFDAARFKPLPRDENLRAQFAKDSEFLLLYAGRLIDWKGIHYLLDALAQLEAQVKLLIAGEGPARARLEQQVQARGLAPRVFFLGRVAPADLPKLYSASDLVVLPSLMHETFSIVACEALACERAIVGTNIGGIPELVEVLVPPANPEALANAIRALLADPARRFEIARRGREKVAAFLTWEATTARVFDVYRRLMEGERVFEHAQASPSKVITTHFKNEIS